MTTGSTATVLQLPVRAEPTRVVDGAVAVDELGDPAEVYRALAPAVLGYLRSQQVADPEDVLGEVFLGVARDLGRFRGDATALRRWVFTIAHHRLVDDRRRRAVRREELRSELPDLPAPSQPASVDPELLTALGRLTTDQREVVALRFVADLPLRDVARITGRRVGAVKALQSRGLERLRSILGGGPDAIGNAGRGR
jgi:RNA polymerase sigma-70 factor (ECF subfamily)